MGISSLDSDGLRLVQLSAFVEQFEDPSLAKGVEVLKGTAAPAQG